MEDLGAGVSINPIAFLVVQNNNVKLMPVTHSSSIDKLLDYVPEFMEKANGMLNKCAQNNKEESEKIVKEIQKNVKKETNKEENKKEKKPKKRKNEKIKKEEAYEFEYDDIDGVKDEEEEEIEYSQFDD